MKRCTGPCGQEKPLDQFYRLSKQKSGLNPRCKDCVNEYNRAYQEANRDAMNRWSRARAQRRWAKKTMGVSFEQFEAIVARANGVCELCGRADPTTSRNGTTYALALDHDHVTGVPRGLLCRPCNVALGCVKDDPSLLRRMADYLENPPPLPEPIPVPKRVRAHTPETRAKIAKSHLGIKSPFKGVPRDPDVKAKISQRLIGRPISDDARANMSAAHKGKPGTPWSPEQREKMKPILSQKKSPEARANMRAARLRYLASRQYT